LIFIDEANFVPKRLWLDLILPLNLQTKTSLLAATSPKGSNGSFCSHLLKVQDNGVNVFNVVDLQEVCKKCIAENKDECRHKDPIRSTNKSAKKMRLTTLLYPDGEQGTANEELLGLERSSKGGIIPEEYVEQFKHNVCQISHRPRAVYCSFDPGGGSSMGQLGITVAVEINTLTEGVKIVVSLLFCFAFQCSFCLRRACISYGKCIPWATHVFVFPSVL